MALALESLVFDVNTEKLLAAKKAIDDLSGSMQNLNKVVGEETKTASSSVKSKEKTVEANESVTDSTKKNITALERQQKILEYMTQGFSKGQASILATASAANTATSDLEKLGEVLQTQRKLIGGDPFDKSMSGLVALTNQYGEIREAIRQYNSDVNLTRNQTRELARDKERIIEKMKLEGATFSQIRSAIKEYNNSYTKAATKVNILTQVERERERSAKDTANAVRNVRSAEERLFSTVSHLNEGISQNSKLNERAALALGSYERNLRLAGISGEEAAKKLQAFKAAQERVSAAEAEHRASYISRGIGVQMGDVGVSLASGMNPLTVAIQQGDQIRGLIQQSGLEAAQMGAIMQKAFGGIVTSFKDVGVAMASFVVGGLKSMGDGIISTIGKVTGLSYIVDKVKDSMLNSGPPTKFMASALNALSIAASVAGGIMATLLSSLSLVGVAMYKSAKANDELLISITTSGAALGMSSKELAAFANANNIAGTSANDLKNALGELASEGFKQKESLALITEAAQKYAQATGKDLNDVLKEYAKVAKDPVESLIKLAEASGQVSIASILEARKLMESGDAAAAAEVAIKAYAEAQTKAANDIEASLSPLAKVTKDLKRQASEAWDSVVEFSNSSVVVESIKSINSAFLLLVGILGHAAIAADTFWKVNRNPLDFKQTMDDALKAFKEWDSVIEERNKRIQSVGTQPSGTKSSNAQSPSGATAEEKANSSGAADAIKTLIDLKKKYGTDEDKLQAKLKEFGKARQDINKNLVAGSKEQIEALKELDTIQKKVIDDYNKKANKESDAEKKKNTEYYLGLLEKISDLNIKNTATTQELTKAEQLLNDAKNDKRWNKLLPSQRKEIENRIENAKAIELETQAYKNDIAIKKILSDLNIGYDTSLQKQLLEIENKNKSIGLSEEQKQVNAELLKIENDRLSSLDKIRKQEEEMTASRKYTPEEVKSFSDKAYSDLLKADEKRKELAEQASRDSYKQTTSFESGWKNAFASYLDSANNAATTAQTLFQKMTDGMTDAIVQFATTGKLSFSDFANSIIKEMLAISAKRAALGLTGLLGGLVIGTSPALASSGYDQVGKAGMAFSDASAMWNANGNAFNPSGIVHAFANGGTFTNSIVNSPTPFMFANGGSFGVMGEAGPEAVMPLQRTPNGKLGVISTGGNSSPVNVEVNVSIASDGSATTTSNSEVAGKNLGNLIAAAVTSAIIKEKRNGGLLSSNK